MDLRIKAIEFQFHLRKPTPESIKYTRIKCSTLTYTRVDYTPIFPYISSLKQRKFGPERGRKRCVEPICVRVVYKGHREEKGAIRAARSAHSESKKKTLSQDDVRGKKRRKGSSLTDLARFSWKPCSLHGMGGGVYCPHAQ